MRGLDTFFPFFIGCTINNTTYISTMISTYVHKYLSVSDY